MFTLCTFQVHRQLLAVVERDEGMSKVEVDRERGVEGERETRRVEGERERGDREGLPGNVELSEQCKHMNAKHRVS